MGYTPTSPKVLEYLNRNANVQVHTADIAHDTGFTVEQVQGAIGNLRRAKGMNIETVIRGQVFILRTKNEAPKPNGKRIFEEVGELKDGRVIIQDVESQTIFEAREL